MNIRRKLESVLLVAVLLICGDGLTPAKAHEIYIGNQPFLGGVDVEGDAYVLDLKDVALMLGYRLGHFDGAWSMEGAPLQTQDRDGRPWVPLEELPTTLVRIVESPVLGILDLYRTRPEGEVESRSGSWGGDLTLLFFYTSWCEVSQSMMQTIRAVEQSRAIRLVHVDLDESRSPAFLDYARYFEGDKIPFFAILDRRGRKLDSFFGFQTYNDLLDRLREASSL